MTKLKHAHTRARGCSSKIHGLFVPERPGYRVLGNMVIVARKPSSPHARRAAGSVRSCDAGLATTSSFFHMDRWVKFFVRRVRGRAGTSDVALANASILEIIRKKSGGKRE